MGPVPDDPEKLKEQSAGYVDAWQKRGERWRAPLSEDEREVRWQRWERATGPAELTELGKRLLGAVPWE